MWSICLASKLLDLCKIMSYFTLPFSVITGILHSFCFICYFFVDYFSIQSSVIILIIIKIIVSYNFV